MKYSIYISVLFLFACNDVTEKQTNVVTVKNNDKKPVSKLDSILMSGEKYINFGKVTNENSLDSVYVSHYLVHDNERNLDKHITYVSFSANVSKIVLNESFGASIFNAGDLNGDGIDEVLILPGSLNGCWGNQIVFSLHNGQWKEIANEKAFRCNEDKRIWKIDNTQFDILIDTGAGGSGHYLKRIKLK